MAARFLGLAVQSDVRCASGTTVAFFPLSDLQACAAVLSPTEPESLSFTIARDDERSAEVYAGRVVRTTFVGGTDDREWDVVDVSDANSDGYLKVTAQPIALRLARAIYSAVNADTGAPELSFDDAAASVTSLIDTRVLPALTAAGLTWIARGTVDSTKLVDLSGEWTSILEIVKALADPGRADAEWQLRRNGNTNYLLDLLNEIGETAPTVTIRTRVNLLENRRKRDAVDVATRLYPRGSSDGSERTIAAHLWRVKTVVSGTVLELEDISAGAGPIAYDDQLNGLYLAVLNSYTFASQLISDSVAATQRVTVPSTAGISAGQWCRAFVGSGANGARLLSLTNPAAAAVPSSGGLGDRARVLDRAAIRGDCNLVPNAWMRNYANATDAADDWTDSAGTPANRTIAREATIVRDSPYTCRMTTTGVTTLALETPNIPVWAISGRRHFCAIWFNVQTIPAAQASALIFELITAAGVLIQELGRWLRGGTPELNTWIRFVPNAVDLAAVTSAVRLRVRVAATDSANAAAGWDVVFGPAMCAESEVPVTDIEYSGGTQLWQEANLELARVSAIARGYDLRVADLAADDATTFSTLALVSGGTVQVMDTDLDETVELRLLEYRPDYLNPLASSLRVGVPAPDIATAVETPPALPVDEAVSTLVSVSESADESGTTGTVTLKIRDPLSKVSAVEYRTVSARSGWSAWAAMTPTGASVYTGTVSMVEKVPARINWRVRGINNFDEIDQVLAENIVTFTMGPVPSQPVIEAVVRQDGTVDLAVIGDSDTASLQIGFSTASQAAANAALGSTQNARQYKFQSIGSLTLGQKGYIAVKAWSGTGASGSGSIVAEAEVTRFNASGSKTIRLTASGSLIAYTETAQFTRGVDYFTALSEVGYFATIPVPKGATLTAVRVRLYIGNAGTFTNPFWDIFLRRVEQSGTSTQIGTASTVTIDAWVSLAVSSLSESTAGDRSYMVMCTPTFATGSTNTARVAWIEYDLDYPDVTINT